ncbi:unnamed protein product [Scytosiphon promiscuus]
MLSAFSDTLLTRLSAICLFGRTATLLALIALAIAASGANRSKLELGTYLARGVNAALLARHFQGICSAFGCMAIVTAISMLVYPLCRWACSGAGLDRAAPTSRHQQSRAAAKVLAVAAPSAIGWTLAVCGAGLFRWGVASGLCVGMQCAALTLKSISFVQRSSPVGVSTVGGASGKAWGRAEADLGPDSTKAAPVVARGSCSNAVATESRAATSGKETRPASNGAEKEPPTPEKGRASVPRKEAGLGDDGAVAETLPPALTFGEFAFFLLLTPSLVCEPRLLVVSARRPPQVAAACSEFFHAALVYLAVHATCSAFFAPVMRVLAEALHSGDDGPGGGWVDEELWAELRRTDGNGWWLNGSGASFSKEWRGCRGEAGSSALGCSSLEWGVVRNVVVAACLGTYVLTPLVNYLMFYAFFHSVCLGSAELWGYPDRNTYGPWWLVMDDVRDYFRLWSAPVHRWLSKSIQRPMIEAGQREARRRLPRAAVPEDAAVKGNQGSRKDVQGPRPVTSSVGGTDRHEGDSGGGDKFSERIIARWWVASVVCSFLVSGTVHEAVGFVAMRRTFWPFSTFFLAFSACLAPFWDAVFPVIAVGDAVSRAPPVTTRPSRPVAAAAVGGDGGEAPAASEKARLEALINTPETPPTAPTVAPDVAEKVWKGQSGAARDVTAEGKSDGEARAVAAAAGSGEPRLRKKRPPIGSHRGWTTVAFYIATSMPLNLVVDYLVWQWWRRTHLLG